MTKYEVYSNFAFECKDKIFFPLINAFPEPYNSERIKYLSSFFQEFANFVVANNLWEIKSDLQLIKTIDEKFLSYRKDELPRIFFGLQENKKLCDLSSFFYKKIFKEIIELIAAKFAASNKSRLYFIFAAFIYLTFERASIIRSFSLKIDDSFFFSSYQKLMSKIREPIIILDYALNFYENLEARKVFYLYQNETKDIFYAKLLLGVFESCDESTLGFAVDVGCEDKNVSFWCEVNRDRLRNLKYFAFTCRDCNQNRISEEEIYKKFFSIYDDFQFFFMILDENGKIIFGNKKAREYFGIENLDYFYKDLAAISNQRKNVAYDIIGKIKVFNANNEAATFVKSQDSFIIIKGIVNNTSFFAVLKTEFFSFIKKSISILIERENAKIKIREIHHRVKNNLQVVSSILNLKAQKTPNIEAKSILLDARDRVKTIALIHENLINSDFFEGETLLDYFNKLKDMIYDTQYEIGSGLSLNVRLLIDKNLNLSVHKMMPLGLLFNEMFTNSLKHAFKGKSEGEVIFKLSKLNDSEAEFLYQDNGIGFDIPEDFENLKSIGLEIIKLLSQQLKGKLTVETKNGVKYYFVFPYK